MPVVNKIGKVMKRNHALVTFDQGRIARAIERAASSIGGFDHDRLDGVNDCLFKACSTDGEIAQSLSDLVVICLNADPKHLVSNFPPTIEEIQDTVLHVLTSYGFIVTADAYACFRWGHHWVREGAITEEQFVRNGYPPSQMEPLLQWNREHGCDTVDGLNEIVRRKKLKSLVDGAIATYEASLDEAAAKVLCRIDRGDEIALVWVSGPSSSGKTTTTVKLTERLKKRGLRFLMLSLDDYFWPLIEHPTDWINDRNYETPEAIDIQLLNAHLRALLAGEPVDKPIYSFKEGRRVGTKRVRREKDQVLLLDCLHGFYPPMTEGIEPSADLPALRRGDESALRGRRHERAAHALRGRPPPAADPSRRQAPQSPASVDAPSLALRPLRRAVQHHPAQGPRRPRPERRDAVRPARAEAVPRRGGGSVAGSRRTSTSTPRSSTRGSATSGSRSSSRSIEGLTPAQADDLAHPRATPSCASSSARARSRSPTTSDAPLDPSPVEGARPSVYPILARGETMPANLTPEFLKAREWFQTAETNEEKLAALERMLTTIPKHKGTDHMCADIKRRIAKLREMQTQKKRGKGGRRRAHRPRGRRPGRPRSARRTAGSRASSPRSRTPARRSPTTLTPPSSPSPG